MTQGWRAQFKGLCSDCEEPIEVGEWIVDDLRDGYVHVRCPAGPDGDD